MAKALILGCSHADGTEINNSQPSLASYPSRLASKMGYDIDNKAIRGGSNDAMFRIFESEYSKLNSNDLVIACWTGINRTEFFDQVTGSFISVNTSSNFKNQLKVAFESWVLFQTNESSCRLNKIKNIIALNSLASSRNLKVINIHSFWPIEDFVFAANIDFPINHDNFWDWAIQQNFAKTTNGHFGSEAHTAFADYILSKS